MKIKELIKHLEKYNPEDVIAYDLWTADDVDCSSNGYGAITQEQSEEVINRMEKHKDASIGLNWDVLNYHLDQVMKAAQK